MKLLYKLLRQDPDNREGIIVTTSVLGIIVNLLIALTKIIIGLLASSIAIVSEGVNNGADVLTTVLTLVGTKLAGKHPDEKHPFGYGRIEYLTGLVVSVLILVTGVEMLLNSIELAFHPGEMSVSYLALAIVAASAVVKLILAMYTIKMGKKADSSALVGVGMEGRGDSVASVITIVAVGIYLILGINVDAYAGMIISALIIKAGLEVLKETIDELLGRPGESELAKKLYKRIRATEGVLGAADMMLHNYGPEAYSGSVNLEIDHKKSIGEMYEILHKLQLDIMHEEHVTMVFGVYAVDNDHADVKRIRKDISQFVKEYEHAKSFHAVYLEPNSNKLYCDIIVDYKLRDWDALQDAFMKYMKEKYPDKEVILTIETEFV